MSKLRVYFDCVRCPDFKVDTAEKMIAHFRLEHGIKPETFSAEKRKAFYDSFQLEENEFSLASDDDEERDDTDPNSLYTEPALLPVTEEVMSSPKAGVTAAESNPLSGTIYRCPHCSRCMGYAILQLQRHHSRYKGSCVSNQTRDDHFICPHCKTDYTSEHTLANHRKKFDGVCKHYQIVQSQNYFRRQEEGKIAMTLDKSEIESLQPMETDEEEDTIHLQPFTHKGHLIPVENDTSYKCPWCLRILGNRIGLVRRHLSLGSGICHKDKVTSESPQCNLCRTHFSRMSHLVRHLKRLKGNCRRRGNTVGDVRVDLIRVAERRTTTKDSPSGIFFCKHCDRCMGYSYRNLRNHLFVTQGKCIPKPYQKLYPCEVCKFDFTSNTSLNLHSKRFEGKCIDNEN